MMSARIVPLTVPIFSKKTNTTALFVLVIYLLVPKVFFKSIIHFLLKKNFAATIWNKPQDNNLCIWFLAGSKFVDRVLAANLKTTTSYTLAPYLILHCSHSATKRSIYFV